MLTSLYVRDFALIDELSVNFASGLTIITGETGAGKSILIGALNMVLGERASAELVRSGATRAVIEAMFTGKIDENLAALLDNAGIERTPELILRRDISSSGQSRCFINDTPCTVSLLKQAGQQLVDLHGQHDHQLLLHAETHASLLDGFGRLTNDVASYRRQLLAYRTLCHQLDNLLKKAAAMAEKRDFLDYQYRELDSAGLFEDEEQSIEAEINLLENAETLAGFSSDLTGILYDSENSAYSSLSSATHILEKLAAIDWRFNIHLEELKGATATIEEINRFIHRYASGVEFNRERLEELRERQMLLQRLAKKHGRSIAELPALRDTIAEELSLQESIAEETGHLAAEIETARQQLSASALNLSEQRKGASIMLEAAITEYLQQLGIPSSTFRVSIGHEAATDGEIEDEVQRYRAFENGYDRIEFLISTNVGETPKPLVKVASGGEISRVMLAMKSALARSANLPILVFDEIDTGISGPIAQAVGFSLKKLSRLHQIIAITHLPQIAAMGDRHLTVRKSVDGTRTVTGVFPVEGSERTGEVARLFSGQTISAASLQLANELIAAGNAV